MYRKDTWIRDPAIRGQVWMRQIRKDLDSFPMQMAYQDFKIYVWLKPRALMNKEFHNILQDFYKGSRETYGEYRNGKYYPPGHRKGKVDRAIRWHTR